MTALVATGRRGWARLGRALEHPAVMPGVAVASGVFVVWLVSLAMGGDLLVGYDAHAYYQAAALDDPYRTTSNGGFDGVGGLYEFKYPPPLAQVLHPVWIVGLSWPAFLGLWTVLLLASLTWMGRRWTLLLLLLPPVLGELWFGNLNLLLGVAVVVGMRWPAAWSFILLTKITPGVGLVWFAVRREWRSLAIALAATVVIVGVSFALAPWLWADFLEASRTQVGATVNVPRQALPVPLLPRLVLSAVLAAWAARTDRAWVLPIVVGLSVPFMWWNTFAVMVAAIPLYAWRPALRTTPPAGSTALPQAQPS
jgi:Glycosyltransferase family 87